MPDCPTCGRPAGAGETICRHCGEALATEIFNRCSNGHIVSDGSQFCPWCGEAVRGGGGMAGGTTSRATERMDFGGGPAAPAAAPESRRTMVLPKAEAKRTVIQRSGRPESEAKTVGFLVSYTLSPAGTVFQLKEGRQNIGSGQNARLKVADSKLSEEHAVILYRGGRFIFEDRLSSNGSLVNDAEAVGQLELRHGDRLTLGSHTYIFVAVPAEKDGGKAGHELHS